MAAIRRCAASVLVAVGVTVGIVVGMAVGILASTAPVASATAAPNPRSTAPPAAEVQVGQEGRIARFGSMVVPVLYRCQRPWVVSGLTVVATQGAVSGTASRRDGLRCDARWHHVDLGVSSGTGDPFTRGPADVQAWFDVQDPVTADPVDQAQDRVSLWVSPAARIAVVAARLNADGSASVIVNARCQKPWVLQEWIVEVTQRNGTVGGFTAADTGLTCDARWHRLTAVVTGNARFSIGPSQVRATLTILDPVDFDPVDQDVAVRTVRLTR